MELEQLTTEQRNQRTMDMDNMSVRQIAEVMNEEDNHVIEAVQKAISQIECLIDCA